MELRKGIHRVAWIIFIALGIVCTGFFVLRLGPAAESAVFVAYSFAAAAAMLAGAFFYRPRPIMGWLLIAAGQVFVAFGDLAFTRSVYLKDSILPAALFEGLYLVGQICFLIGIVHIFIRYRRLITSNAVTQGIMVASGLSALVWILVVSPNLQNNLNWVEWARVLVYPFSLLIIVSIASIYLMTSLGRGWNFRLLFLGLLCYSVGLIFYIQMSVNAQPIFQGGPYNLPYSADAAYSLAYLLLGTAYLHPSMRGLHEDIPERISYVSNVELILLAVVFWISPLVYIIIHPHNITTDLIVMLGSMLLIFSLNEWRLSQMVRALEERNIELTRHREMLRHQAFHDALTGLPNRAFLHNHLETLIGQARATGVRGAVFLIDVNNFKQVNDLLGHDEGDRVLKEVSNAFLMLMRKEDVVGRWGGDEFMMLLKNLTDETSAKALARRLQQEIRWTVTGSEGSVSMSISIGICLIPNGSEKLQTIVKKADLALYQAKRIPEVGVAISPW